MARWVPKKQALSSQLPQGSEDVAFKKTLGGPTIAKAHAAVLANHSKTLHDKFYPISEGQTFPMVLDDWTHATGCEVSLKAFVKILYGTGPTFASLDLKTIMGVYSLAAHYQIPELMTALVDNVAVKTKIPLPDIASCITLAHKHRLSPLLSLLIERTIKSIPGKVRIMRTPLDLDPLKGHLGKILPTGTDLDGLLDTYKKFLALKVWVFYCQLVCSKLELPIAIINQR